MKTFNEISSGKGAWPPKPHFMKPNKKVLKMYPEITNRISQGETVDDIFLAMDWQNYGVNTFRGQQNVENMIRGLIDKDTNK